LCGDLKPPPSTQRQGPVAGDPVLPPDRVTSTASTIASMRASSSALKLRFASAAYIAVQSAPRGWPPSRRSHALIAQHPGQRHLRQRLPAQAANSLSARIRAETVFADVALLQETALVARRVRPECRADSGRSAVPAPRSNAIAPRPPCQHVEKALFGRAHKHRIFGLMNQAGVPSSRRI